MRIREFTPDDYPAAVALWEASEHVTPVPRDEVLRSHQLEPELFLLAEDGDRAIGVVIGSYDGRRGWIFRLAVDPTRRAEGVGSALVAELERRFREREITHIRLLTLTANEGAARFWDRSGYDRFEDIVMYRKELAADDADPC